MTGPWRRRVNLKYVYNNLDPQLTVSDQPVGCAPMPRSRTEHTRGIRLGDELKRLFAEK